jgi:hypothetical protein
MFITVGYPDAQQHGFPVDHEIVAVTKRGGKPAFGP